MRVILFSKKKGATVSVPQFDGASATFAPTAIVKWPAPPAGAVTTKVLNKTTGTILFFGQPPTVRQVTDTSPRPGVTNSYEVTHALPMKAVGVNGTNFTAGGVVAPRCGGMNIYGLAFMSSKGISEKTTAQFLYAPTVRQVDMAIAEAISCGAQWIRVYGSTSFDAAAGITGAATLYPVMGGGLSATALAGLDLATALCHHHGLVYVLTLFDNYTYPYWRRGMDAFNGWGAAGGVGVGVYSDATAIDNAVTFVTLLANHVNQYTGQKLANMPNIVWQTHNEDGGGVTWNNAVAAAVHGVNANAIVIGGTSPIAGNLQADDRHQASSTTGANIGTLVGQGDAGLPIAWLEMYGGDYTQPNHHSLLGDVFKSIMDGMNAQSRIRVAMLWTLAMKGDTAATADNGVGGGRAAGQGWYSSLKDTPGLQEIDFDLPRGDKPWQDDYLNFMVEMNGFPNPAPALYPPQAFAFPFDRSTGVVPIGWIGSPGARGYTVSRSQTGPDATDFTDIAVGLTETDSPYYDLTAPAGDKWYRVKPMSSRTGPSYGTPGNSVYVN